ncbi:hypothetical protein M5K25_013020 [Dendrobium thyrsiflorum]|uniref:Uncharacterized protein n=1 Tax=Dendrobium thyrsiflorum TaxID=117978 RepID=A0ABD0UYL5_DENTH
MDDASILLARQSRCYSVQDSYIMNSLQLKGWEKRIVTWLCAALSITFGEKEISGNSLTLGIALASAFALI